MKTTTKSPGLKTKTKQAIACMMLIALPLLFTSCEKELIEPIEMNFSMPLMMKIDTVIIIPVDAVNNLSDVPPPTD